MTEYLTTRELAELLRIKERKVYDLAASGKVPCSRATGRLLFPRAEIEAWIERQRTGTAQNAPAASRPNVILGSHDPLLEWAIRQSQCGLAMYFDGSTDGLQRFAAGEGIAAGLHLMDSDSQTWNILQTEASCSDTDAVLIGWATRQRGLVCRAEDAESIKETGDVRGKIVAARQAGSGAQVLISALLDTAELEEGAVRFTEPMHSEMDAVLAVAEGSADVAFGLGAVAKQYRLSFTPLTEERFDIAVSRRAYFGKPFQKLLEFCKSDAFIDRAAALSGYDISRLNTVIWNA